MVALFFVFGKTAAVSPANNRDTPNDAIFPDVYSHAFINAAAANPAVAKSSLPKMNAISIANDYCIFTFEI